MIRNATPPALETKITIVVLATNFRIILLQHHLSNLGFRPELRRGHTRYSLEV